MFLSPRDLPRFALAGILIYAPWAYGSTRPWAKEWLAWLLLGLAALFVISLVWERRRPQIPAAPLTLGLALLAYGWFMTWNVRAVFDPVGPRFHDLVPLAGWLPATVDHQTSLGRLLLITGLMAAFFVACDQMSSARGRDRLWIVLALIGLSLIFFGLVQNVTRARAIFWVWGEKTESTFFATYRYHGNAGAFINLIIPLVLTRTVLSLKRSENHLSRAFWCISSFLVVVAAFVNVSRAAMVVAVFLCAIASLWLLLDWRSERHLSRPWEPIAGVAALVLAIVILATAFGVDRSQKKWARNADDLVQNTRYQVYDVIWKYTLPVSGWKGLGPGTFELAFPLSAKESKNKEVRRWYWKYAHQDYLQTLVEWGWVGSALWAGLLGGGLLYGLLKLVRSYKSFLVEDRLFLGAACLALLGICLHALIDFPLQIASLQLYTAMVCAVVWTCGSWGSRRKRKARRFSDPEAPGKTGQPA